MVGKNPYRADDLLALRGVAALCVVCHHMGLGATMAESTGVALLGAFAVSGSYAVWVFFCLSGYLMAKILDRDYRSIGCFYRNRFARVLPTYYLAVIATAVLAHRFVLRDWPMFLLADNYLPSGFPNPALWSLATEVQFYLVAPLIALATARCRIFPIGIFGVSLAVRLLYAEIIHGLPTPDYLYESLETNLMFFMAGWSAHTYRQLLPSMLPGLAWSIIGSVAAVSWLFHFEFIPNTVAGLYASWIWMIGLPLLVAGAMFLILPGLDQRSGKRRPSLRQMLLYGLGVTSYSVYVVHFALIKPNVFPNIIVNLSAIYAVAACIFFFFERPLFRLRGITQPSTSYLVKSG
jgi:peptidoglycan/LPS O-acetylase OafA/YrhL